MALIKETINTIGVNYGYHACRRHIAYDEKAFVKTT